jgi:rhodanese-related sulfurtransferase
MTAAEFREYLESQNEGDYLVIDVRQESEYELGHIPGAGLMPLADIETRLFSLPTDRDLIFYCHNGGRSQWAASLVSESKISKKPVYHLMGGLLAWDGNTVTGYPKVQLFDAHQKPEKLFRSAMNLEKGTWRFYRYAMDKLGDDPAGRIFNQISIAEKGHASLIYRFVKKFEAGPPPFERYYRSLAGDILEGGLSIEDACALLQRAAHQNFRAIIDLALAIEYAAFDLYRVMADLTENPKARETFLAIAQAEKGHMRALARSI